MNQKVDKDYLTLKMIYFYITVDTVNKNNLT